MKISKQTFSRLRDIILGALLTTTSFAQGESIKLTIGDDAPELKYGAWLKGDSISQFEKDKLYVLEFWATWCGPCKAAMPHLTELAKKYENKATFIGVNIWEKIEEDQSYESVIPEITRFVNSIGDKMDYNVIVDNSDEHMSKKWMRAAGQKGIPSTYLLKEGKIVWIGHPMHLDSIMNLVITNKYDMAKFKSKFEKGRKMELAEEKNTTNVLQPLIDAHVAKEYDKVLSIIDTISTNKVYEKRLIGDFKFKALLGKKKETEALGFAKEWIKEDINVSSLVAEGILKTKGLSKDAYLYSAELYKSYLEGNGIMPIIHQKIAKSYAMAGDFKMAITHQEKAIETAKEALKNEDYFGTILDYTVTDYEKELVEYKKN